LLGVVVPVADGKLLVVYNVHLKSKVSSDPDDPESNERRSREARYVRRLIEYNVCEEKTAEKIPASVRARMPSRMEFAPPELFLLLGDFNDVPASKPLASLEVESFARSLPARNDTGGILTFFNPQRGYFHTFDRIFASPEIFKKYYVPSSAKIAEFPWSQTASDHRLVYADFDFLSAERRSPEQLSDKK
jgi:endonuclease/exonuclease/phosphatase family metal-dependent hydrolase